MLPPLPQKPKKKKKRKKITKYVYDTWFFFFYWILDVSLKVISILKSHLQVVMLVHVWIHFIFFPISYCFFKSLNQYQTKQRLSVNMYLIYFSNHWPYLMYAYGGKLAIRKVPIKQSKYNLAKRWPNKMGDKITFFAKAPDFFCKNRFLKKLIY